MSNPRERVVRADESEHVYERDARISNRLGSAEQVFGRDRMPQADTDGHLGYEAGCDDERVAPGGASPRPQPPSPWPVLL